MRFEFGGVLERAFQGCVQFGLTLEIFRRTLRVGGHQAIERNGAGINGGFGIVSAGEINPSVRLHRGLVNVRIEIEVGVLICNLKIRFQCTNGLLSDLKLG
jgi:hypothetical protein